MMMLVKRCVEDQGKKLVEPPEVLAVTEKYRAEQDMLSAFIAEHLQRNESGRLPRGSCSCVQGPVPYHAVGEAARPEQIGSMVTKFKATALGEPEGRTRHARPP
jgi:phage/plasmid-associated DNA primase